MNKRDIIIVAVLLNTGLLSMLAIMAIHTGESFEEGNVSASIAYEMPREIASKEATLIAQNADVVTDEWDSVLKDYVMGSGSQTAFTEEDEFEKEVEPPKKTPLLKPLPKEEKPKEEKLKIVSEKATKAAISAPVVVKTPPQATEKSIAIKTGKTIEVTVKKGDALEKIARSNGTTAEQIKALNNLKSDRLAVGQQLLIPVEAEKTVKQPLPVAPSDDMEYYVLKSGDNPWKIAKQFKVKFEDLLKLNQLDEEKARNLKIGDRIRVK